MTDITTEIRLRFDHQAAKKALREKYQAKMLFAFAGGMWRAGPILQSTLLTCPGDEAVLIDEYDNPVRVNTKELMSMSQQRWQEQMNAWLVELTEQQTQR